jgi:hypothetical protein
MIVVSLAGIYVMFIFCNGSELQHRSSRSDWTEIRKVELKEVLWK